MGKRKTTRQQRRKSPEIGKPPRAHSPGKGISAGPARGRSSATLCRREQDASPRRKEEESFAGLFSENKTLQDSFSDLVESYLAVPTGREDLQENRRGGRPLTAGRIREYPAPQEELDLHRHTGPEAQRRIGSFIQAARSRGSLTLRIITGKGLHSAGPAILPEVAESKLLELKDRGLVLAFRWDKKKKEKSGAIIVYLKQD